MDPNNKIVLFIDELHLLLALVARHKERFWKFAQTAAGAETSL